MGSRRHARCSFPTVDMTAQPFDSRPERDTPGPRTLPIGAVLQETYRILRPLAEGGCGEIFLAEHTRLPGRFAVKILHRGLAAGQRGAVPLPPGSGDHLDAAPPAHRPGARLQRHGERLPVPGDGAPRGGVALAPGRRRRARSPRRRRSSIIEQIALGAARGPRARDRPPRPQARQRHAAVAATASTTSSRCSTSGSPRRAGGRG